MSSIIKQSHSKDLIEKKTDFLRGISKEKFLENLQVILKKDTHLVKGYVFGSFLTPKFGVDSDLDLLFITDLDISFFERYQVVQNLLNFSCDWDFPLDYLVYTQDEFDKLLTEGKNSKSGFWHDINAQSTLFYSRSK